MMILERRNAHARDLLIKRKVHCHGYNITGFEDTTFTSVTTWVGEHFGKFDPDKVIPLMMRGKKWNELHECWGMAPAEIKQHWSEKGRVAAEMGTALHDRIEVFMNRIGTETGVIDHSRLLKTVGRNLPRLTGKRRRVGVDAEEAEEAEEEGVEVEEEPIEWEYFLSFLEDTQHLVPFRTEWMVFHEEWGLAGCIDMVYVNDDGTLSIYDWKRCTKLTAEPSRWDKPCLSKHMPHVTDTKFNHYALQINVYKAILEAKYGFVVRDMCLVQLHPENDSYRILPLPDMSSEIALLV